jgi:hypothetical protein
MPYPRGLVPREVGMRIPSSLGKAQRHRLRCSVLGWMAFQGLLHIATTYLILALLGLAQLQASCTKPIALQASS